MQFLQTAHPPSRRCKNRAVRVHRGFLATWYANGVRDRVLAYVDALIKSHPNPSLVRTHLCTLKIGASLGRLIS